MCRSIDLVERDVFGRCVCGLPFLVLEPNQPSHLLSLRVTLAIPFRTLGKGMTSVAMVSWIWKRCATRHQTFSRGWFGWYRFECKHRKTQMKSDQAVRSPSIAVPIRATAFCVLLFGGHCETSLRSIFHVHMSFVSKLQVMFHGMCLMLQEMRCQRCSSSTRQWPFTMSDIVHYPCPAHYDRVDSPIDWLPKTC